MTKNTTEANESILILKEKLSSQPKRKSGGLARVSKELRAEAVALRARLGLTRVALAKQLAINPTSMFNWERSLAVAGKRKKRVAKSVRPAIKAKRPVRRFREVQIAASDVSSTPVESAGRIFALELASGARVTGLRLSDLAKLINGGGQ